MFNYSWTWGSSRYELVKIAKTFADASFSATQIGGRLAEMDFQSQNTKAFEAISAQIPLADLHKTSAPDGGSSAYVWLGGSDSDLEGSWKWITSNNSISLFRQEWGSGAMGSEPDNFENQDGLALGLENWPFGSADGSGYGDAGSWNDLDVNNQLYYLVEFDMVSDTQELGTANADRLRGNGNEPLRDYFQGDAGDDELIGVRGADILYGDEGNDTIRGGNGRDVITGGLGSDNIYGGFGHNTFAGEKDGSADNLYFKSDQFASNWIYGKAGNNANGRKADIIKSLDTSDRLFVQGVETSELTFSQVTNFVAPTGTFSGIGIFANGFLEGLYTGGDLSTAELRGMTSGVDA